MGIWSRLLNRKDSVSKNGSAAGQDARAGSKDALSPADAAPRLDVKLTGRSSPIDPGAELDTGPRARASVLTGTWIAVDRDGAEVPLKAMDAILEPTQALALLEPCCAVIKARALDTLGIFRPHRTSESSASVRRIIGVYLRSQPGNLASSLPSDLFGRMNTSAEELRTELEAASIHDVVSVMHWALRHLRYDAFAKDDWFATWTNRDDEQSHPADSYRTFLLPLIAEPARKVLTCVLDLIAVIAARSETNGMGYARMCRLLALPVLGRQNGPYETVEALKTAYEKSSEELARIFLAYLRAQKDLPARLQELTVAYPRAAQSGDEGSVAAIRVTLEVDASKGRSAGDTLEAALSAQGGAEHTEWANLVQAGRGRGMRDLIATETGLVINQLSPAKAKPEVLAPSPRSKRSMSLDRPTVDRKFSASRSGNLNAINEARTSGERPLSPAFSMQLSNLSLNDLPDTDWQSFASTGFSTEVAPLQLSKPTLSINGVRPSKLRKPQPNGIRTDVFAEEPETPAKVIAVASDRYDDVFAQLWLDTLADKIARTGWPSFVIVDLQAVDSVSARMLMIEEVQPRSPCPPRRPTEALARQPSADENLLGTFNRAGVRRKSSLFGRDSSTSSQDKSPKLPSSSSSSNLSAVTRKLSKPRASLAKKRAPSSDGPTTVVEAPSPVKSALKPTSKLAFAASPDGKMTTGEDEAMPRPSDVTATPVDRASSASPPSTVAPASPVLRPQPAVDDVSTLQGGETPRIGSVTDDETESTAPTAVDEEAAASTPTKASYPSEVKEPVVEAPTLPTPELGASPPSISLAALSATPNGLATPHQDAVIATPRAEKTNAFDEQPTPIFAPSSPARSERGSPVVDPPTAPLPETPVKLADSKAPLSPTAISEQAAEPAVSEAPLSPTTTTKTETPSHSREATESDDTPTRHRQPSTGSHGETPSRNSFETASVTGRSETTFDTAHQSDPDES